LLFILGEFPRQTTGRTIPRLSIVCGVGNIFIIPESIGSPLLFTLNFLSEASARSGVFNVASSNNPHPIPAVGRVDGASWNNKRLDAITSFFEVLTDFPKNTICSDFKVIVPFIIGFTFQVNFTLSLCHCGDTSNIFANNPSGLELRNNSQHFRPEITVICLSLSFAGLAEWLAREAPGEEINADK
jgi:hypothetical protein